MLQGPCERDHDQVDTHCEAHILHYLSLRNVLLDYKRSACVRDRGDCNNDICIFEHPITYALKNYCSDLVLEFHYLILLSFHLMDCKVFWALTWVEDTRLEEVDH